MQTKAGSGDSVAEPLCYIRAVLILQKASFSAASELRAGWVLCNKQYDALRRIISGLWKEPVGNLVTL